MINGPDDFHAWFMGETRRDAERLAAAIFDGVVRRTPVYTGSLRASWHMSTGKPVYMKVTGDSPRSPLPPPSMPKLSISGKLEPIFITNGQPYAYLIENGHSTKAPAGMLQITLDELL